MDWKLFASTFIAIFVAELGDKTQLASVLLAAESKRIWTIFFSASLALIAVTFLGVVFAEIITAYLPANLIKKAASLAFIAIGILIFFDKL
ncbi:MAG: TMEM165/GDT1 family protein [Desulfovibrionales bacterium]